MITNVLYLHKTDACSTGNMALNIIYRRKENNFIIFSDSMSGLQAVTSFRMELDLVYQIIKEYSHLTESGKRIVIWWIPSHVNIPGNEKADSAAKSALTLPITKMKIPLTEYIPGVSQFCLKEWQDIWNCCEGNKLHAIYPNVGRIPHCKNGGDWATVTGTSCSVCQINCCPVCPVVF